MSTQPIVPVPTDPAATPPASGATEPPKPTEPAAAAPPATTPPVEPKANVWEDPEAAKAEIERLRRENGAARTTAKQQAADEARTELAQTIGKALGIVKDDAPVDPAALVEQATSSQADAKQARVELAVFRNAGAAGGDPLALLDSASFLAKASSLDPTDTAAITAAITEAVTANPRLGAAAGSRVPAPNPAQGTSGGGPVATDIDAQIAAATQAGNHALAISLKRQKAYANKE